MSSVTQDTIHSLLEVMPSKECHCHRCGARIAEGDLYCAACGKKQQVKNTLLLDYLISHTKDSITGKITDSIYEAIKNFLLSHLFGVVVTLSLVAAVGITVYASEPYIQRVAAPYTQYEEQLPAIEPDTDEPVEDDTPAQPEEEPVIDYEAYEHSLIVDLLFDYWYTAFKSPDIVNS